MKQICMRRDYRHVSSLKRLLLGGLIVLNVTSMSAAYADNDDTEAKKLAVAKALCGQHGLLSKCIGLSPESCPSTMKPLVDACHEKKDHKYGEAAPDSDAEGFLHCIWAEYFKRFSSRIQYTDECTGSGEGKSPIEELPPHLEAQTRPLHEPKGVATLGNTP